jgi:hypothetical protein
LREQRAGCQQTNDQEIDRLKHLLRNGETLGLSTHFILMVMIQPLRQD